MRADIFTCMELLIEDDERIVPGTVEISEEKSEAVVGNREYIRFWRDLCAGGFMTENRRLILKKW